MKIIFFDKVVCEGTKEECEAFRKNLIETLSRLDDELKDTYPPKQTDTWETYFEALKMLNPFVYETLSYFKECVGERFASFYFFNMGLAGVGMEVYENLETKKIKTYVLSYLFFILTFGLDAPQVWRVED